LEKKKKRKKMKEKKKIKKEKKEKKGKIKKKKKRKKKTCLVSRFEKGMRKRQLKQNETVMMNEKRKENTNEKR